MKCHGSGMPQGRQGLCCFGSSSPAQGQVQDGKCRDNGVLCDFHMLQPLKRDESFGETSACACGYRNALRQRGRQLWQNLPPLAFFCPPHFCCPVYAFSSDNSTQINGGSTHVVHHWTAHKCEARETGRRASRIKHARLTKRSRGASPGVGPPF